MSIEVKAYLNKAHNCLEESQELFSKNYFEGSCNRAYYAVFDSIRALLETQQIDAKSHSGCHSKFREFFIKTNIFPKSLNEILTTLFDLRQGSDYELYFEISHQDAENALLSAKYFVNTIEIYLKTEGYL
jgi:uncharacterized protein (UPF0332 family)